MAGVAARRHSPRLLGHRVAVVPGSGVGRPAAEPVEQSGAQLQLPGAVSNREDLGAAPESVRNVSLEQVPPQMIRTAVPGWARLGPTLLTLRSLQWGSGCGFRGSTVGLVLQGTLVTRQLLQLRPSHQGRREAGWLLFHF